MVQKFNQKLNKQAGAEEVEVEAPQPENITSDDKPMEETQVIPLAVEPLKLEVTEEVVVLQVTPREHYKNPTLDSKPDVTLTTTEVATSPVKPYEPVKDVKPVETKATTTLVVETKPTTTTTNPTTATAASSSPLDQFFQAGESRREKERIVS